MKDCDKRKGRISSKMPVIQILVLYRKTDNSYGHN